MASYLVEITKTKGGLKKGTKKSLSLALAKDLETQKIGKIIGKVPSKSTLLSRVANLENEVSELKAKFETVTKKSE